MKKMMQWFCCSFIFASVVGFALPSASFSSAASPLYSGSCGTTPINSANFCAEFKRIAECNCLARGMPQKACQNMNLLYNLMKTTYGSLEKACAQQTQTSLQNCLESWNCYQQGGKNKDGQLCSGTGKSCV